MPSPKHMRCGCAAGAGAEELAATPDVLLRSRTPIGGALTDGRPPPHPGQSPRCTMCFCTATFSNTLPCGEPNLHIHAFHRCAERRLWRRVSISLRVLLGKMLTSALSLSPAVHLSRGAAGVRNRVPFSGASAGTSAKATPRSVFSSRPVDEVHSAALRLRRALRIGTPTRCACVGFYNNL